MTQRDPTDYPIDPTTTSGIVLAERLNRSAGSWDSTNSGSTRPTYLEAGGTWLRTDVTPWELTMWDGVVDRLLATINATTGKVNFVTGNIPENGRQLTNTGLVSGGEITAGATSTQVNIAAGIGVITSMSDPSNQTGVQVDFGPFTNVEITDTSAGIRTLAIDSAGQVVQVSGFMTSAQHRSLIRLGRLDFNNSGAIDAILNIPTVVQMTPQSFIDGAAIFWNGATVSGRNYSANANLTFNISAGSLFVLGSNWRTNQESPNITTTLDQIPVTFDRILRDGTITQQDTTLVDPLNYDLNGVLTPVGGNNARSTNQFIWYIPVVDIYAIQYGDQFYASLDDALAGLTSEFDNLVINNQYGDVGQLYGAFSIASGATDLSLPASAIFTKAGSTFSAGGGGGSGGGATSLGGLSDVELGTLTNGEVLTYNSVSGLWENAPAGSTATPTFQNVTYSGDVPLDHNEGRVYYDPSEHRLVYENEVDGAEVYVGSELVLRVRNLTGATIAKGSALTIVGVDSGVTSVALAIATDRASATVVGLAAVDIPSGTNGYSTIDGILTNVNTVGYAAGDLLYLSPTVAGGWTTTKPDAFVSFVGIVLISHLTQGKLFARGSSNIISNALALPYDNTVSLLTADNTQAAIDEVNAKVENIPPAELKRAEYEFTDVAGQDTFAFEYSVGLLDAYYNGVKLLSGDYTATNETSVILAEPVAASADTVSFTAWGKDAPLPSYKLTSCGFNLHGALTGDGSTDVIIPLTAVLPALDIIHMDSDNHTFVVLTDNTLWGFGQNTNSKITGDGVTVATVTTATQIATDIQEVVCGNNHTLALTLTGDLLAWGKNDKGQCRGDGTTSAMAAMAVIATGVKSMAASRDATYYVTDSGDLYAFGNNNSGQTSGDGVTSADILTAAVIDTGIAQVYGAKAQDSSNGANSVASITDTGDVKAWGSNDTGESRGDGTMTSFADIAVIETGVKKVVKGQAFTLLLMNDATVKAFGRNDFGSARGDGTTSDASNSAVIATDVADIAAGGLHSILCYNNGTVWAFGYNNTSQVSGDGSTTATQLTSIQLDTDTNLVIGGREATFLLKPA